MLIFNWVLYTCNSGSQRRKDEAPAQLVYTKMLLTIYFQSRLTNSLKNQIPLLQFTGKIIFMHKIVSFQIFILLIFPTPLSILESNSRWYLLWTKCLCSPKNHVEALTPNVSLF